MSRPSNRKVGAILAATILTIAVVIGLNGTQEGGLFGARVPTLVVDPNPVVRNQPYTLTGFNFQKYKAVKLVFSDDGFTTVVNPTRGGFKYLTNTQTQDNQFMIYAYDASSGPTGGALLAIAGVR